MSQAAALAAGYLTMAEAVFSKNTFPDLTYVAIVFIIMTLGAKYLLAPTA